MTSTDIDGIARGSTVEPGAMMAQRHVMVEDSGSSVNRVKQDIGHQRFELTNIRIDRVGPESMSFFAPIIRPCHDKFALVAHYDAVAPMDPGQRGLQLRSVVSRMSESLEQRTRFLGQEVDR